MDFTKGNIYKVEANLYKVEAEFDFTLIRKVGLGSYAMLPAADAENDDDVEYIIEEYDNPAQRRIWDEKDDKEFVKSCYGDIMDEFFDKCVAQHWCPECGDTLHAIEIHSEWLVYDNKVYSYTLSTRPDWWSSVECCPA